MVVVTFKYVMFLMRADNKGEGGTLSLMALAQHAIGRRSAWLFVLGVCGAALFYSDGVITPAISVLSAVEGLQEAPGLNGRLDPFILPLAAGILIAHETHRGRILYNAWATRDMLREFPALHITADLSHFVVVAERVFHDADDDWAACMKEIARACRHIHARVGYAQGPQAPDPRAPEYADALAAHEAWWRAIEDAQAAAGTPLLTVEPEHGTDGYQQRLPYSTVETACIWTVNAWLRERCEKRHRAAAWFEK
jgi:hypothetical protein